MKLSTDYEPGGLLPPAPGRNPVYKDNPEMVRLAEYARAEVPNFDRMSVHNQHKILQQLKREGV